MIYSREGEYLEYIFNDHNLLPNTKYNLIYYPQEPIGLICIGEGESNNGGKLRFKTENLTNTLYEDTLIYFRKW